MGCGQSKGDPERELMTSKITPLLRRRFEEIKGRKNNNTDSDVTLSKRGLLKHSNHEDDPSLSNSHCVDENSNIDKNSEVSRQESVRPSSVSCLKDKDKWEQNRENKATDCNQLEQERKLGDKAENDEEKSEAEGRLSSVDLSYLSPGSPSFRVYCVDQSVENAYDKTDDHKDDEFDHKYEDDDNGETVPSANFNELPRELVTPELVTPRKGKGKNGGRFMKVMSKINPAGAVKNLLHVTSCYHTSKARRHKPRLVPQEAA